MVVRWGVKSGKKARQRGAGADVGRPSDDVARPDKKIPRALRTKDASLRAENNLVVPFQGRASRVYPARFTAEYPRETFREAVPAFCPSAPRCVLPEDTLAARFLTWGFFWAFSRGPAPLGGLLTSAALLTGVSSRHYRQPQGRIFGLQTRSKRRRIIDSGQP